MAEHDPADVEYMARFLTAILPQGSIVSKADAIRALDWMQADGVKIMHENTNIRPPFDSIPCWIDDDGWDQIWSAAPLTPRSNDDPA